MKKIKLIASDGLFQAGHTVQYNSFPTRKYTSQSVFNDNRGSEFKNKLIDEELDTFGMERSLSDKGKPYDNAVSMAAFKKIKRNLLVAKSLLVPITLTPRSHALL
ncbi:hypothetical protein [Virgibacillus dokdonensis]|uniref:Integrase catalytic domain-containing protein n=1 Tax=Virgibacillus dokdonensis TaxID=302167 RepID=A0A2K9IV12_9BACI|nr:hypothetical protein A21D_00506 [Virgibacillus dokdonensis]